MVVGSLAGPTAEFRMSTFGMLLHSLALALFNRELRRFVTRRGNPTNNPPNENFSRRILRLAIVFLALNFLLLDFAWAVCGPTFPFFSFMKFLPFITQSIYCTGLCISFWVENTYYGGAEVRSVAGFARGWSDGIAIWMSGWGFIVSIVGIHGPHNLFGAWDWLAKLLVGQRLLVYFGLPSDSLTHSIAFCVLHYLVRLLAKPVLELMQKQLDEYRRQRAIERSIEREFRSLRSLSQQERETEQRLVAFACSASFNCGNENGSSSGVGGDRNNSSTSNNNGSHFSPTQLRRSPRIRYNKSKSKSERANIQTAFIMDSIRDAAIKSAIAADGREIYRENRARERWRVRLPLAFHTFVDLLWAF